MDVRPTVGIQRPAQIRPGIVASVELTDECFTGDSVARRAAVNGCPAFYREDRGQRHVHRLNRNPGLRSEAIVHRNGRVTL